MFLFSFSHRAVKVKVVRWLVHALSVLDNSVFSHLLLPESA